MIELVYMSQARHVFHQAELDELLVLARKNNTARGITGLLLYDGVGMFIQAIEGEQEQIDELFGIINADPRHGDIRRLSYSEISSRSFSEWKMGFQQIDNQAVTAIEGYSGFLEDGNSEILSTQKSFALDMLNHFKQMTNHS